MLIMKNNGVIIEVTNADALDYVVDVLVLKHSQALYGLDHKVVSYFYKAGEKINDKLPPVGEFKLFDGPNNLGARKVMFVGTPRLNNFGYREIRDFAQRTLAYLNQSGNESEEIAVTVHGVGYGLDEEEAFSSQLAGFVDGITKGQCPASLKKITIIEHRARRASILKNLLNNTLPGGVVKRDSTTFYQGIEDKSKEVLSEVGYTSNNKAHVFVAIPYRDEMEDVWDYGIKPVVKSAGYICERADLSSFTGDVMQWVRSRIKTADIVVADLTGSNPNVYLEVGYAWGVEVPTILLCSETEELKFDVRGQRCLMYGRIKDLEKKLINELETLKKQKLTGHPT